MILHTGRFQLRPVCAADAQWIARDIANPKVHRWLTKLGFTRTSAVLVRRANSLGKVVPIDRVCLTKDQWHRRKPA